MPPPDCITIRASASTVWGDSAVPQSLLRDIAAEPGNLIRAAACRPVKIDRESLVLEAALTIGDRSMPVAVKRYRPRTFWKALAASIRATKAVENWQKAEFLRSRSIATPRPLLACRPRDLWASNTSFLVTQWIARAENLHLFGWRIAAGPCDERLRRAVRCAEALGQLLGRLHASGASHRDLKAANLLVVEEGPEVIIYLVDLDGLQPGRNLPLKRQARDVARLAAGLAAHPWVTRSICRRFLRAYLRESPEEGLNWKPLWRAIASETAAYVRRKQKRGRPVL